MASSMTVFPLEKYQEGRQLGQGGFGTVYLYCLKPEEAARGSRDHNRLPVTVAVKRIVVTGNNAISGGQLYHSEYELLSGLRHMNIVELLGRNDNQLQHDIVAINLVMEACHGDLRALMNARGSLQPLDASVLIRQALLGLKYLHSNNIVHKDLKPENILLLNSQSRSSTSTDWSLVQISDIQAKITDFGLAKFYQQDETSFSMTVAGTPFYMCPRMWEAMLQQQPFRGHWSVDQFSMGVISYELMTGSRKQDKTAYSNTAELRANFNNANPDIVDFLIGMLREDPKQRRSAEILLSHPFIRRGQEHLNSLRANARVGTPRAGGLRTANDPTVEALKRQMEQNREQSDRTIAQLTQQLTNLQSELTEANRLRDQQARASDEKLAQIMSMINVQQTSPVASLPRPKRVLSKKKQKRVNDDLLEAAKIGNVDRIRTALDGGADIECKMGDRIDINGWGYINPTPLIIASASGHLRAVECLLSHGCEVDSTEEYGKTALHAASWAGHKEIVLLLLDKGASVNKVDKYKCTALHLASYNGRPECVRVLLERGADSSVVDYWRKTAFQWAGRNNPSQTEDVLSVFREFGVNR